MPPQPVETSPVGTWPVRTRPVETQSGEIGQVGTAFFGTAHVVTLQVEIMYIGEPCKIICKVRKYYSPTDADGKTFVLVFFVL